MRQYLEAQMRKDLKRKMVFVGGPRQVGNTTLARTIHGKAVAGYMSWDIDAWQISASGKRDYVSREGVRVAPGVELLSTLV
jgi:hypothetical protein